MKNINWKTNQGLLKSAIAKLGIERLLVHADSFKSLSFIDFDDNEDENLKKHVALIMISQRLGSFILMIS